MTTTVRRHSVALAGLLLLSLLVLALSLDTSHAMTPAGTGTGGGGGDTTFTQAQVQLASVKHAQLDGVHALAVPTASVEVASTGGTSATTWIILAVVLGMLSIAAWLLVRRRNVARVAGAARAFCTLNPDDPKCSTA